MLSCRDYLILKPMLVACLSKANSKGVNQTTCMHRQVFAVLIQPKIDFISTNLKQTSCTKMTLIRLCILRLSCTVVDHTRHTQVFLEHNLYEPRHEISNNVVCATSKASDQPAHMHSLIRSFACRWNIL